MYSNLFRTIRKKSCKQRLGDDDGDIMIKFRDFAPPTEELGLLGERALESLEHAVESANHWINTFHVEVVNVETVLLPNIYGEAQTGEGELRTDGDRETSWYQIVRVWYHDSGPIHDTSEIRVFTPDDA